MNKSRKQIKIVGLSGRFTHSCLAIFYVRNELEKNCPDFVGRLYQFNINENYYDILLQLTKGKPSYIFFSAAVWNSNLIEQLTLDLGQCLTSCRVVIGGPQAAVLADRLGQENCSVVIGEIEAVGTKFYHDLQSGSLQPRYFGDFFSMQGQYFDYPYRGYDFVSHLKNRHIYYESSRGCPFACTYCLSASFKGVYYKELTLVEQELNDILNHRPKVLRFLDRTFNALPERALHIWKFLAAKGGETLFHFEMAPDRFTEEMFEFLADLGHDRFQFELGIQSTHEMALAEVNRRVDPITAHQTIARLAAFGNIYLHVDLILGLPYETYNTFADSFRDVFAIGPHYIQMGLLKILPTTPLRQQAQRHKYRYCSEPPYTVLQNKWMDHETLSELYWFSECVERFLNNRYFVSLWHYLRRREEDVYIFFHKLLLICHRSGFFQLAATQELMCTKLVELVAGRKDQELIIELLRYDWLRCGFCFLPDHLKVLDCNEQPKTTKDDLYQSLPKEIDGVYSHDNRNQFFRKSFFVRISQQALAELGLESIDERPCLCVFQEREKTLYGYNRIMIF